MIRTSDVAQSLEVRHHSGRIRVESYFFAMLSPHRVTCHAEHDFIGSHLFHQSAGFHSLTRIDISQTGILVGTEHTARNLAKSTTDQMMYIIRGFEHSGISGLHIISGRFAETLGDVHIVPVGQGG